MIKKMSIFGISFAFLGLAFLCESANALQYYCYPGTKPSGVSNAAYYPVQYDSTGKKSFPNCCTGTNCSNYDKAALVPDITWPVYYWACNDGYYYSSQTNNCVKIPDHAKTYRGTATNGKFESFQCVGAAYYNDGSGCKAVPNNYGGNYSKDSSLMAYPGFYCKDTYYPTSFGSDAQCAKLPDHAQANAVRTSIYPQPGWSCVDGYKLSGSTCVKN